MRVYTVEEVHDELLLTLYKSKRAFEEANNWCDDKFICVATTKDLENYEFVDTWNMIVYTEVEKKAHLMLRNEYLKLKVDRHTVAGKLPYML